MTNNTHSKTNHINSLRDLTSQFAQKGRLDNIYLRPAKGVVCVNTHQAEAIVGLGIKGDRVSDFPSRQTNGSKRQVTLIQSEHLTVIEAFLKKPINPILLRRNLLISGINLIATKSLFKDQLIYVEIGDVILEVTGPCEPCSKMEVQFGEGAYNAIRGHGGVTARIIKGGVLNVGDPVSCRVESKFVENQISLF